MQGVAKFCGALSCFHSPIVKGEKMKTVLIVVGIIVAVVLLLVLGGLGGRMMGRFGSTGFGMMFPFFGCLLTVGAS